MSRLNLLFAVSECVPFAKVGGLGDVAGALPLALSRRGHDVRLVMPRYRVAKDAPAERVGGALEVRLGDAVRHAAVYRAHLPQAKVPVYLIEHDELFDRDGVYGANGDYPDNPLRFAFLSRAALAVCGHVGFRPDVIHAHDWPTALVPVYARTLGWRVPTLLTIHNLGYQGRFDERALEAFGLTRDEARRLGLVDGEAVNVLRGGLVTATRLSTVSSRYAAEIRSPEGGAGLDPILRERSAALTGILNGIDDDTWNPETDPLLPATFGVERLEGKARCKAALQRELDLPERPEVPLFGVISRLVSQKGVDLLAALLPELMQRDLQLAVLGSGERWAEEVFSRFTAISRNVRARIGFDERLAHLIEGAADFFVMPSRYEPCGLNQLYSQRYGALPIVRAVGGLDDSVEHGVTGIKFTELSPGALLAAIDEALAIYRDGDRLRDMQRHAMRKAMGWDRSASHYEALYRLTLRSPQGT